MGGWFLPFDSLHFLQLTFSDFGNLIHHIFFYLSFLSQQNSSEPICAILVWSDLNSVIICWGKASSETFEGSTKYKSELGVYNYCHLYSNFSGCYLVQPKTDGSITMFWKDDSKSNAFLLSSFGQSTSQLHQTFDSKAKNAVVHKTITLRVWSWCNVWQYDSKKLMQYPAVAAPWCASF